MNIETCAFCGKTISGVTSLIKSPINDNIYICDRCAEISVAVICSITAMFSSDIP